MKQLSLGFSLRGMDHVLWSFITMIGLMLLGVTALIDDLLLDQSARLRTLLGAEAHQVMVVQSGATGRDIAWSDVLHQLQQAEPQLVVFPFAPTAGGDFYQKAAEAGNVVFGLPARSRNGRIQRDAPPKAAEALDLSWGVVMPTIDRPVPLHVEIRGRQTPTLPAQVLRGLDLIPPADDRVRLDMAAALPNATLEQLVDGQLPQDLWRNRVVVVGDVLPPSLRAQDVVVHKGGRMLTHAEHHAVMIDALIEDRVLHEPPLWLSCALAFIGLLFLSLLNRALYIRPLLRMMTGILGLLWLSALIMPLSRLYPPMGAWFVAVAVLFLIMLVDRYRRLLDRLRQFRLDFGEMSRRHIELAENPPSSGRRWFGEHVDDSMFAQLRNQMEQIETKIEQACFSEDDPTPIAVVKPIRAVGD